MGRRSVRRGGALAGAVALGLLASGLVAPDGVAAGALTATPTTISGATLRPVLPAASAPSGVSPDVFVDPATGTFYLYTTDMPSMRVYTSPDGRSWSPVAGARTPQGFDPTVVQLGPGDYRMYYASILPNTPGSVPCAQQRKALFYATSTDLVTWTSQPGPLLDDVGCGVPDVVRKPDGTYLLYYVTMTGGHGVHIATSPDGLAWTPLPGLHPTTTDIVDPSVVVMPDGTYLMVASDMGGGSNGPAPQRLHIASSPDGLTWTLRPTDLYAPRGRSAFDPNLNLVDGQLRVWFGYSNPGAYDSSRITDGALSLASAASGQTGTACPTAGKKKRAHGMTVVCRMSPATGALVWTRR